MRKINNFYKTSYPNKLNKYENKIIQKIKMN